VDNATTLDMTGYMQQAFRFGEIKAVIADDQGGSVVAVLEATVEKGGVVVSVMLEDVTDGSPRGSTDAFGTFGYRR
jgi:hypothetical protein